MLCSSRTIAGLSSSLPLPAEEEHSLRYRMCLYRLDNYMHLRVLYNTNVAIPPGLTIASGAGSARDTAITGVSASSLSLLSPAGEYKR